jgi:hypothetical protein
MIQTATKTSEEALGMTATRFEIAKFVAFGTCSASACTGLQVTHGHNDLSCSNQAIVCP